jgi:hypothetical protein
MLARLRPLSPTLFCIFALAMLPVFLAAGSAAVAQEGSVCGDAEHEMYALDAESGISDDELEALYGHCANYVEPTSCEITPAPTTLSGNPSGLTSQGAGIKVVTNRNIFYERLNGCGYHPQSGLVACDVEIRRAFGYAGLGAPPFGSFEHVLFCGDCNGNGVLGDFGDFVRWTTVHTNDHNFFWPFNPSHYHLAFASNPPAGCSVLNGRPVAFRAILSWARPPASCAGAGFGRPWGNQIDWTARLDP